MLPLASTATSKGALNCPSPLPSEPHFRTNIGGASARAIEAKPVEARRNNRYSPIKRFMVLRLALVITTKSLCRLSTNRLMQTPLPRTGRNQPWNEGQCGYSDCAKSNQDGVVSRVEQFG